MGATLSLLVTAFLWGLKARADPSGVATIFRCNPMYRVVLHASLSEIVMLTALVFECS